jgi:hypothetical protein
MKSRRNTDEHYHIEAPVRIEKKYCNSTLSAFAAISCDTTVDQHQASLLQTRMALARWMRGGDIPHVHASERHMPMRATWYAQAQRQFQDWLDAGGFHGANDECLECAFHEGGAGASNVAGPLGHDERAPAPFPVPGIASWPAPDRTK